VHPPGMFPRWDQIPRHNSKVSGQYESQPLIPFEIRKAILTIASARCSSGNNLLETNIDCATLACFPWWDRPPDKWEDADEGMPLPEV
jgi:hypothetical protein